MYRYKIILYYIYYSFKGGIKPWKIFQLNAQYFNKEKGIFSKYEIESYIPEKWKLKSLCITSGGTNNISEIEDKLSYPLFLKPEWGQNSHGIHLVKNREEFEIQLTNINRSGIDYVAQEGSSYNKEFEIYFIRDIHDKTKVELISMVESVNSLSGKYCINGIYGKTNYINTLDILTTEQKEKIISYINEIKEFKIGRIGIKSQSIEAIVSGEFDIFEINIFLPFALHLLDENISKSEKEIFIKKFTQTLALLTKQVNNTKSVPIFFTKMKKHYLIKIQHNTYYMKIKTIIYAWIEKNFMDGCSDYNSLQVRRSCRSKKQARSMFEKNKVPHAEGLVFFNPYSAYKFVEKHGFPIVLKPNVGGYSRGSFFPIENYKDFWKAMFLVKLWWPTSVIEQYLLGKNYRVVVTKDSVDIAMQRYPGFVIGDGSKNISTLIDEENTMRRSMNLLPIIHEIEKSQKIKKHIKKQGFTFESILQKDQKIFLYHRVSLAPGGLLETIEVDTITPKNKELFLSILNMFDANLLGIDVIMEQGIDVDYDKQKCIFLEVNSRAYLEMHRKPRYGKPVDLTELHKKLSKIEITGKGTY